MHTLVFGLGFLVRFEGRKTILPNTRLTLPSSVPHTYCWKPCWHLTQHWAVAFHFCLDQCFTSNILCQAWNVLEQGVNPSTYSYLMFTIAKNSSSWTWLELLINIGLIKLCCKLNNIFLSDHYKYDDDYIYATEYYVRVLCRECRLYISCFGYKEHV